MRINQGLEKEDNQTDGVGISRTTKKSCLRSKFTAKRCAVMAVFVALSLTVSFLEFPIFPAVPFLRLDFGNCFIMLVGFLLGPMEGIIVCVLKELLRFLLKNDTGGVGELANMLVTSSYIFLPTVLYRWKKGLKTVILSLCGACVIAIGAALLVNRFLLFPAHMGAAGVALFNEVWSFVFFFNLIKGIANAVLTVLLYKKLSVLLKKWKI